MIQPLVSVVVPFYSNVGWLKEALDSVQKQTYKNIEVLVINDGSKEEISGIDGSYDVRIRIINKENGGPASARNLGIESSSGKYIAFLDSDDLWLEEKLSEQIAYMESTRCAWSQHSYEMFWENNGKTKIIDTNRYSGNVYRDCFISFKIQTSCVVVLRKVIIENNIRFPLEKRYGQDGEFYKEIAKHYPLGSVNNILSKFRIRGSNAGFRAKVQLNDKAETWSKIKDDNGILMLLPRKVKIAYKVICMQSAFVNSIERNCKITDDVVEAISKALYLFPYIAFKIASKSRV